MTYNWQTLVDWAQVAPIFSLVVVLFGAVVASRQLALNRANQRETTAKTAFREYLKLAFDHPEYTDPKYPKLKRHPEKWEQYQWFVAYLLWTCEEVVTFATDESWKGNLIANLEPHREFFEQDPKFVRDEEGALLYDKRVVDLVDSIAPPDPVKGSRLFASTSGRSPD